MKSRIFLLILMALGFAFSGCSQKYAHLESLDLKSKNYPNPEEISTLSFALAEPDFKVRTVLSYTLTSAFKDRLRYDTEQMGCHLTNELDKILLSKGFTITDRFRSYNNMTFTQKRNTSALFFPKITISVEEKTLTDYIDNTATAIAGDIVVSAHVKIIMLEPLSGEKVWIKSIPVDDFTASIEYTPTYEYGKGLAGAHTVPEELGPIALQLDEFFVKINEAVIEATNKYVEQNEFEFLNDDIKRLKGIKRY